MNETNKIEIAGIINEPLSFSHEKFGEKFYTGVINVRRISGSFDHIKIMLSERLPAVKNILENSNVLIRGQFRSYNSIIGTSGRLILTVFGKEAEISSV